MGGGEPTENSALNSQIGGQHYKDQKIQPIEYIHANDLGFCEGNVVKYVTRHKQKNGAEDVEKSIHYLELLLQLEYIDSPKARQAISESVYREHYFQAINYCVANKLGYCEGVAVVAASCHKYGLGEAGLRNAIAVLRDLLQLEYNRP